MSNKSIREILACCVAGILIGSAFALAGCTTQPNNALLARAAARTPVFVEPATPAELAALRGTATSMDAAVSGIVFRATP